MEQYTEITTIKLSKIMTKEERIKQQKIEMLIEANQIAEEITNKFYKLALDDYYIKKCSIIVIETLIKSHINWATEQDECVYLYKEVKKELEKL